MNRVYQTQWMSFRPDFFAVDSTERKIFFHLMRNSIEFSKMDDADKNVLAWMVIEMPGKVNSWLEFVAIDYKRRKGIQIDVDKLVREIQQAIFAGR
jgi:hypothetical protein